MGMDGTGSKLCSMSIKKYHALFPPNGKSVLFHMVNYFKGRSYGFVIYLSFFEEVVESLVYIITGMSYEY